MATGGGGEGRGRGELWLPGCRASVRGDEQIQTQTVTTPVQPRE